MAVGVRFVSMSDDSWGKAKLSFFKSSAIILSFLSKTRLEILSFLNQTKIPCTADASVFFIRMRIEYVF